MITWFKFGKRFCVTAFWILFGAIIIAEEIKPESLILKGNAKIADGVLKLDGKDSFALLPGTENYNIDRNGLSLACVVKLNNAVTDGESAEALDMFFSKADTPFVFGRYGGRLYTNIKNAANNNKMGAASRSMRIPEAGIWTHVAVTFEYYDDHAQGDVGYYSNVYVNGDPVARVKHPFLQPATSSALLDIGKGWGGPWHLNGEIAEINIARRVMNEAEIAELVDSSRLVKVKPTKKINPELKNHSAHSEAGKWMLSAINRLMPLSRGVVLTRELADALSAANDEECVKAFGDMRKGVRLIVKKDILLLVDSHAGIGTPLLGVYDRPGKRAVLEDRLFGWNLSGSRNGVKVNIHSSSLPYSVEKLSNDGFTVNWNSGSPLKLTAKSDFRILDSGLEADLKIDNPAADFILANVVFPETRTAKLGGDDTLLYPYQCGALIKNPTRETFKYGQNGRYPGASLTMQFTAYYGNGRGVFLGWRDPDGTIKDLQAVGKRDGVEFTWSQDVAIPLDSTTGGNNYVSPGKVAFCVYSGEWFEACMIHKKWALTEATWKTGEYPRQDTAKWFRDVPVAFDVRGVTKKLATESYNQLMFLRNYLDLPVYSLWFNWYDLGKGSWPVFEPRPFMPKLFEDIMKNGCYIEPYIDARLWDILDGPDRKSDYRWSSHGKKFAVKRVDGSIPLEYYGKATYAVMCPAAAGWQQELFDLTKSVAKIASAVYHDQVMASRGYGCYDKTHGHALNDPNTWLNQGYRPLYRQIRQATPGVPHISEEVSEPYLDIFDGGHVWRWTFDGQVPAFQAIYGGRIQYFALIYDKIGKGEYSSNFVKMASSLVNGIKIGRLGVNELYHADAKRLFLKKMSHVRFALNDYFNAGDMLSPIKFAEKLPLMTTGWSTSGRINEPVTMAEVVSNSYSLGENIVYIFVNTTDKKQKFRPLIQANYLCHEELPFHVKFSGEIQLGAYETAIAVNGQKHEAARIQQTLQQIHAFTPGESFDTLIKFDHRHEIKLKPGEFAGIDKVSGYFGCITAGGHKYFGNMSDGSMVSYGIVDFGTAKVSEIMVSVAVSEQYAGGEIDLLAGPEPNIREKAGTFVVPATGSWTDFKEFKFKLDKELSGKCNIVFRFNRSGCCNFAGWQY